VQTNAIIPRRGSSGSGNACGILHLPDALKGQATVNIVEYCRVSKRMPSIEPSVILAVLTN